MANTWLSDWEKITQDWDPEADKEKFDAIARLFHAANYDGHVRGVRGDHLRSVPKYTVGIEEVTDFG